MTATRKRTPKERIDAGFKARLKEIQRQERWWQKLSDEQRAAAPDSLKEWFANVPIRRDSISH